MRVPLRFLCFAFWATGASAVPVVTESPVPAGKATEGANAVPVPQKSIEEQDKERFVTPAVEDAIKAGHAYLNVLGAYDGQNSDALLAASGASPYMGESRMVQWRDYCLKMSQWLLPREKDDTGKYNVDVIASAMEGNMAALIFALFNAAEPLDVGILPVLVYKDSGRWVTAPFLTNFSNTKMPLDHGLYVQQNDLARWARNTSRDLVINATRIAETRIQRKMEDVRTALKVNEASGSQLVDIWMQALRRGDVMAVAALGEVSDNTNRSSAALRYKQAHSYVTTDESALWQLRLTNLFLSPSSWIVPLENVEQKENQITLGVIPFKYDSGEDVVAGAYSFTFGIVDRGNGGKDLSYPKELLPKAQNEFWDSGSGEILGNGQDEDEIKNLQTRIWETYLKGRPDAAFDSPMDFAQAYVNRVGNLTSAINDYFDLHDKSCFDNIASIAELAKSWHIKSSGEWKRVKKLIAEEKLDKNYPYVVKKSTDLVNVNQEKALLLASWYKEGMIPRLFDIQSIWMEKKNGKWLWFKDKEAIKALSAEINLPEVIERFQDKILRERLKPIKEEALPPVPEWDEKKETAPDASLVNFLKKDFSDVNSLYHFLNQPHGFVLDGDTEVMARYEYDRRQYFPLMTRKGLSSYVFEEGSTLAEGIVLNAVQYGDWAMLAVSFRRADNPFILGYTMVKEQGEWKFVWTGTYVYMGDKVGVPVRDEKSLPVWKKSDPFFLFMFNQLVKKNLFQTPGLIKSAVK